MRGDISGWAACQATAPEMGPDAVSHVDPRSPLTGSFTQAELVPLGNRRCLAEYARHLNSAVSFRGTVPPRLQFSVAWVVK
jgi:hypothetical protein